MSGYSHLSRWERDQIAELKAAGRSVRAIALSLGRAASTISRELRRNALDGGAKWWVETTHATNRAAVWCGNDFIR